jgi:hypothetical protein
MYALSEGQLFFREGRSETDAVGTAWTPFPGTTQRFKHIDAGNNELWAVNIFNEIYRRHGDQGVSSIQGVGVSWKQYTGTMIFA